MVPLVGAEAASSASSEPVVVSGMGVALTLFGRVDLDIQRVLLFPG